ncbi:MAG TPA: hypothetical protein VF183_15665 [Acidimicrobiales bacterium]
MTRTPRHRNARAEAQSVLGDDALEATVLEPSPPAVVSDPFADDPTVAVSGRPAVTPTTAGAHSWDELARHRPELATFAADHWLGAWRRLPPVPTGYAACREALHVLAFYVISPARRAVNQRIGLRWTKGGFGTPFFGDDTQVRVEGTRLVVQTASGVRFDEITTLRRAGHLVDRTPNPADRGELDAPEMPPLDAPLRVDEATVAFLDAWFGFGPSVLEQLRVDLPHDTSLVQLWPEHFDVAVELGHEPDRRATHGFSPGDAHHPEPYVYVSAWSPVDRRNPFWNDTAFNGASLSFADLASAGDQRARALEFLHAGYDALSRSASR